MSITRGEDYYRFLSDKLTISGGKIFELTRGSANRSKLPRLCEDVHEALFGMVQLSVEQEEPSFIYKRDIFDAKFGIRRGDLSDLILGLQTAVDYRFVGRISNYPLKLLLKYAENRSIEESIVEAGLGKKNSAAAWNCIGEGLRPSIDLINDYIAQQPQYIEVHEIGSEY